jgi:ribosome biogenesis protein Nip4
LKEAERFAERFNVKIDLEGNAITNFNGNVFISSKDSLQIADEIMGKSQKDPFAIGTYLGNVKEGKFEAAPAMTNLLANTKKKVTVNDKAEWLFLCGRDVFNKSVERMPSDLKAGELVVVENKKEEVLGIARVGKDLIKNILDKGAYLRMER